MARDVLMRHGKPAHESTVDNPIYTTGYLQTNRSIWQPCLSGDGLYTSSYYTVDLWDEKSDNHRYYKYNRDEGTFTHEAPPGEEVITDEEAIAKEMRYWIRQHEPFDAVVYTADNIETEQRRQEVFEKIAARIAIDNAIATKEGEELLQLLEGATWDTHQLRKLHGEFHDLTRRLRFPLYVEPHMTRLVLEQMINDRMSQKLSTGKLEDPTE